MPILNAAKAAALGTAFRGFTATEWLLKAGA